MNKYINTFSTISDYNTNWNSILSPSVSYIKTTKSLIYDAEYTTNKSLAKEGWIACRKNGILAFYNPKSSDVTSLTSSDVIGIVVIPEKHTGDGTVRIASLDYMDYNNPTTGNTSSVGIYWGYNGAEVPNLPTINKVGTYVTGTTTTALNSYGMFPTNYDISSISNVTISASDNDANRVFISSTGSGTPSPYNTDGSINKDYMHIVGSILSQGLCGKENTDKIMAAVLHDGSIQNKYDTAGYYPAAECCRSYKDGSWYLPSQAELGYLCANLREIQYARTALGRDALTNKWFWSSSLSSSYAAWALNLYLNNNFGNCDYYNETNNGSVLAFVAL